jgi:hypothetical protein
LTNAPVERFETKNLDKDALWKLASNADANNFIMGGNTPANKDGDKAHCLFDLICQHAYSVLGVETVTNSTGYTFRLLRVRNPHEYEYQFNGTWADGNEIWKSIGKDGKTFAEQAHLIVANDGIVLLEDSEYLRAYDDFFIAYSRDNWISNFYDQINDTTPDMTFAIYRFTLT